MSSVTSLKKYKQKRAESRTLCHSGFHKWELLAERRFDVKEGRLVSTHRCKRCGVERTRAT